MPVRPWISITVARMPQLSEPSLHAKYTVTGKIRQCNLLTSKSRTWEALCLSVYLVFDGLALPGWVYSPTAVDKGHAAGQASSWRQNSIEWGKRL